MTQIDFGPIVVRTGNSAKFVVEFLDTSGNLTIPSSGTVYVAYTNTSNSSQTDTVSLTPTGSFFTGTWSSTSAALGIATWTLLSAASTSTMQTGTIRVVSP